ncbi:hypothetical protein HanXRQr2_Chr11g0519491 [Helianthus annuus]|uniref:Uncharacterized protein n=1 Tax=Helianthus annuus TaxID=4232 RepID=A0A9K3N2V8_HELAN|nr:hypothetical protein HanXRQr2_Chr11g0519491 [Helianthus annuus]KAJ0877475.1 hypothetical protein HanPSC8_Chr11g0500561 [Helianthus annuus]
MTSQIKCPARQVFTVEFSLRDCCIIIVTVFAIYMRLRRYADENRVEISVLKLQVGLSGIARSLQKDLNQIAETADTSTPKGFGHILQGGSEKGSRRITNARKDLMNFLKKKGINLTRRLWSTSTTSESKVEVSDAVCNKYVVVTIIVAASGAHELPPIKTRELVKIALQKLASISSNNILAVEVLWTPQKENDTLTEQNMLQDYPLLHPL